jgi:transcriptional regulator with XRE-family HTH domain
MDIKKLLGKRIKELRAQKGLTQERLAELIGVGERNLSKIECGNNFVKAETVTKLLAALDVEPKELFDFGHHNEDGVLKNELITSIQNETIDVNLLYRIYKSIK